MFIIKLCKSEQIRKFQSSTVYFDQKLSKSITILAQNEIRPLLWCAAVQISSNPVYC